MGKASRDKGKRGEREVVDLFKAVGFDAHRAAQVDGTLSCDVVVGGRGQHLHVEVKRYAKIAALRFMEQARQDALAPADCRYRDPVVFMREDNDPRWVVMLDAEIFLQMFTEKYL